MLVPGNFINMNSGVVSLSDTSIFINQEEVLSNGLILLRMISDLLGDLSANDSINTEDLSAAIRLAEELIQIGVKKK
ncbi:hypothetical protein MED121_01500 [Marinomonas sp. MED121]|uniref:hypothetical protein n=1 Tax=Marinomonas sp. MED121 TaxID=314277 RepID=UPI0000690B93|nr:hypothetical protein [Marinomonas sp. MED121]EAQ65845.1 hypothetical protein MED121_01500 [Marinomonas sp. MED121]